MTKEQLAAQLDGAEYPFKRWKQGDGIEDGILIQHGLVIVYGESDDLMEFEGTIADEVGAYGGTTVAIDAKGIIPDLDQLLDDRDADGIVDRAARIPNAKEITAIWDRDGLSWQYETEIPHATFLINEDGEAYCRGIVFCIEDLKETT